MSIRSGQKPAPSAEKFVLHGSLDICLFRISMTIIGRREKAEQDKNLPPDKRRR